MWVQHPLRLQTDVNDDDGDDGVKAFGFRGRDLRGHKLKGNRLPRNIRTSSRMARVVKANAVSWEALTLLLASALSTYEFTVMYDDDVDQVEWRRHMPSFWPFQLLERQGRRSVDTGTWLLISSNLDLQKHRASEYFPQLKVDADDDDDDGAELPSESDAQAQMRATRETMRGHRRRKNKVLVRPLPHAPAEPGSHEKGGLYCGDQEEDAWRRLPNGQVIYDPDRKRLGRKNQRRIGQPYRPNGTRHQCYRFGYAAGALEKKKKKTNNKAKDKAPVPGKADVPKRKPLRRSARNRKG